MNTYIETSRLIIRELRLEDAAAMYEMDSDPDVHQYLGKKPYTDIQQSIDYIKTILQQYNETGIGRWVVTLKDSGEVVGRTGFRLMRKKVNGHVDYYDFGYRNLRRYWNKGYAYEAARASLDYGIDVLGFRDIYGMTDVENMASRHLLEKLGFEFIEVFKYDAEPEEWRGLPVAWYKLLVGRL